MESFGYVVIQSIIMNDIEKSSLPACGRQARSVTTKQSHEIASPVLNKGSQ